MRVEVEGGGQWTRMCIHKVQLIEGGLLLSLAVHRTVVECSGV